MLSEMAGESVTEQTDVRSSQGGWVHQGNPLVSRGQPNVRDAQRHRQTSEHPFHGPAESPQALGTSSSSEEEAFPVATGFRDQITEPPHPRDRQMDGRAKAFQPSLHRRRSLRMPGLAAVASGLIRRHRPWTSCECPLGHFGGIRSSRQHHASSLLTAD
jgi:hypothetical protein